MSIAIVVHGGAGAWDLRHERTTDAVAACRAAATRGYQILRDGGSALDAVEFATHLLEDAPMLDAGRGSYFNAAGFIEMDALIMDGRTLGLGAVGAVQQMRHPISLARRVMQQTAHTFLVGAGAMAFADAIGFPRCAPEELIVGEAWQGEASGVSDTVGVVALDAAGNLASATSTGGTRGKMAGRVGDSPLVGAGGYADNQTAAVSATGHGEALMKVVISKRVCDYVERGMSLAAACDAAIRDLALRVAGEGGVIAVDPLGTLAAAFNTRAMPHAGIGSDGVLRSGFEQPFDL